MDTKSLFVIPFLSYSSATLLAQNNVTEQPVRKQVTTIVSNPNSYPYNRMGQISVKRWRRNTNGKTVVKYSTCSAQFVGSNYVVMSAGHCLPDYSNGWVVESADFQRVVIKKGKRIVVDSHKLSSCVARKQSWRKLENDYLFIRSLSPSKNGHLKLKYRTSSKLVGAETVVSGMFLGRYRDGPYALHTNHGSFMGIGSAGSGALLSHNGYWVSTPVHSKADYSGMSGGAWLDSNMNVISITSEVFATYKRVGNEKIPLLTFDEFRGPVLDHITRRLFTFVNSRCKKTNTSTVIEKAVPWQMTPP